MITFFVLSLLGLWVHEAVSNEFPEQMDVIPKALPVWKEPIVVSVLAPGYLQYMRSIVREKRARCFTPTILNYYNALLERGYDQSSALMMAHENCDPDVCPYCTRPKMREPVWARPVPIPKAPDGAKRCKHRIVATRCAECWLAKNRI